METAHTQMSLASAPSASLRVLMSICAVFYFLVNRMLPERRRFCRGVLAAFFLLVALTPKNVSSYEPNKYYSFISDLLIRTSLAENGVFVSFDAPVAGVISAKEIGNLAEEIVRRELSHREEINVDSFKGNESKVLATETFIISINASVVQLDFPGHGFSGKVLTLSIYSYRSRPPLGTSPPFHGSLPKVLEISSDNTAFKQKLELALLDLLNAGPIAAIREFDSGD